MKTYRVFFLIENVEAGVVWVSNDTLGIIRKTEVELGMDEFDPSDP